MKSRGKVVITSVKNMAKAYNNTPFTETWFVVRSIKSMKNR